ncbi:hypothetical protein M8C21_015736, partial [Ambrosia artemisiifolia]
SIASFGIYRAFFLYKPVYSSFQNWDLINSFVKMGPKRIFSDKIKNAIYDWSYNQGYIDAFYGTFFTTGVRKLTKLTHFFYRRIIDGIPNEVGFISFFVAEILAFVHWWVSEILSITYVVLKGYLYNPDKSGIQKQKRQLDQRMRLHYKVAIEQIKQVRIDTYQYAWIIPFLPLPVPMLIGLGLLLFPMARKSLRRMWAFQSVLLLSIVMIFSINLSIQQINSNFVYQYVWSWIINNDFSLEFGYLIDPLTSIMSILITTVGIMVLIYSDNYMSHDHGYLRFFAYMSFFSTSMLGLVTSSNLIQIYIFWQLVGMCSYLLIGFWFTRPVAAKACQKAFVTNHVGDFDLLLGILGFYWITGSFEFRDLFQIFNNLISNNEVDFLFVTLCAVLLFA